MESFDENRTAFTPPPVPPAQPETSPPLPQQPNNQQPISQKTEGWKIALTIIFLIFMPVVGIILLWLITNWSKTAKWIITIIIIIIILLLVPAIIVIEALSSARYKARDVSAQATLSSLPPVLELYRDDHYKYPVANSFSKMSSMMIAEQYFATELQEPTPSYHYKYCSTNGTDYKLEVEQLTTGKPYVLGTDSCQPGE